MTEAHAMFAIRLLLELRRSTMCSAWECVLYIHPVPKLATPLVSNTPNSACSSWILTKYRRLHYLSITHRHSYYDVRTLPCVLSEMSLLRQSLFALWLRSIRCYW